MNAVFVSVLPNVSRQHHVREDVCLEACRCDTTADQRSLIVIRGDLTLQCIGPFHVSSHLLAVQVYEIAKLSSGTSSRQTSR